MISPSFHHKVYRFNSDVQKIRLCYRLCLRAVLHLQAVLQAVLHLQAVLKVVLQAVYNYRY
jgi:hypothetical protein